MEEETTGLAVGGGAPSDCEGGESRDGDSRDSEDEVRRNQLDPRVNVRS
jgi:hypothetical protein